MRDAELALAVEAAGQWGMFTAAQATRLGMTRKRITQLCAADRIHHTDTRAVYRFAGTPTDITLDAVRATWLALEPSHFAGERLDALRAGTPGPLASHLTAAHYLYELGTLQPDHLDYTVPTPRRTNNPWIRFHVPDSGHPGDSSPASPPPPSPRPSPTSTPTASTPATSATSCATRSPEPSPTSPTSPTPSTHSPTAPAETPSNTPSPS